MVVKSEFQKLGLNPLTVELGEVELAEAPTKEELEALRGMLQPFGFSLIDNKKSQIIERIKSLIINVVHYQPSPLKTNLSDYLSSELHLDYTYISNLFATVEGTTIEHYYITQRIERVKELLIYDEMTLSEIAYNLNYSSVAYLSNQFKKVTGFTPTYFKQLKENKRKTLDEV
ncbi:MAG: AraC family transcriptional regulator [Sphingobacteriales bacterium JAD_PAG50586_3]|nr:MAG: AraC family transcriptional regulator [Sphingobacteriales bacterium JAD_PAG50586_3]